MNNNYKTLELYKRLFSYIKPFGIVLCCGVIANVIYALIDAGFTYMLKEFVNRSFITLDNDFVKWIPFITFFGITLRGTVSSTGSYCMTWVARSVVKIFRLEVFKHIIRLPARYYDNSSSGQMLSKILYDVEQIAQVSADALTTFVQSLCLVIGLLVVMFVINWRLSLLFLITIPFIGVIVKVTNKRIRRVSHAVQRNMGVVTEIAEEAIESYKVVRIFGGQQYEVNKFEDATERSRKCDMKVAITKAINVVGVQIVIAIGITIIIYASTHLTDVIKLTAGGFISIIAAMIQLIKPMKNLTTVNSVIQRGLAGAESVFNILDEELELDQGTKEIESFKGDITYRNVSFHYEKSSSLVLNNINLTIKSGQSVALVGRSGSGKSTIANLLPRFYSNYDGEILLDGIEISDLKIINLRKQISFVSQQVTLFNDTIAKNIAYGVSNASLDDVKSAAKKAHALEFINELPYGLDTIAGENGVLLSGGQRQRIAIARAILKDAPILILDEATSALDTESERYIQSALDEVMKDRTTLVIAHRLSTIEKADHIIVLDHGKIVEIGTHQQLLDKHGYYASLYKMQFNDE